MVSTSGRSSRGPCFFQQFDGRNELRPRATVQRSQLICDEFDVDVPHSSTIIPVRSERVCESYRKASMIPVFAATSVVGGLLGRPI